MPRRRSFITFAVALAIVFAGGLAAGFVYQHEPERDALVVQLHAEAGDSAVQTIVGGEVLAVGDGFLLVRVDGQDFRLDIPPDAAFDELRRVDDPSALAGARVNVGGIQTVGGLVLTGIVALEESP